MEAQNNIVFPSNLEEELLFFLRQKKYSKIFILCDENSMQCTHYLGTVSLIELDFLQVLKPGERYKNIATVNELYERLLTENFDRKALLINLGGGVVTDLGGFVASTYKRGIEFINIPTSLLAMVDASVGGKTGINVGHIKNSVGTFAEPQAVFIYPKFLETLPKQHLRNGFAEVLKHGLVADKSYWEKMKNIDPTNASNWQKMIETSVVLKSTVVNQDFKENGLRKVLNFGHTIGHAMESIKLNGQAPLLHGEAIAIGMLAEAQLSLDKGFLAPNEFEEIKSGLLKHFSIPAFSAQEKEALWSFITNDKKNSGVFVNCTLLRSIGKAVFDVSINETETSVAIAKVLLL